MNKYPDRLGPDELDRRPRMQDRMPVGDAIGGMIAATVFGLTRAVDRISTGARPRPARASANDELILEASGWR